MTLHQFADEALQIAKQQAKNHKTEAASRKRMLVSTIKNYKRQNAG